MVGASQAVELAQQGAATLEELAHQVEPAARLVGQTAHKAEPAARLVGQIVLQVGIAVHPGQIAAHHPVETMALQVEPAARLIRETAQETEMVPEAEAAPITEAEAPHPETAIRTAAQRPARPPGTEAIMPIPQARVQQEQGKETARRRAANPREKKKTGMRQTAALLKRLPGTAAKPDQGKRQKTAQERIP